MIAPLDDPTYDPVHKPVRGRVPDVVAKWGRRSQLRWWARFRRELAEQRDQLPWVPASAPTGFRQYEREGESGWTSLGEYWIESEHHKDLCCRSCYDEYGYGTGVMQDGWCCCRDERIGSDHER